MNNKLIRLLGRVVHNMLSLCWVVFAFSWFPLFAFSCLESGANQGFLRSFVAAFVLIAFVALFREGFRISRAIPVLLASFFVASLFLTARTNSLPGSIQIGNVGACLWTMLSIYVVVWRLSHNTLLLPWRGEGCHMA